jgi:hypothetical protein
MRWLRGWCRLRGVKVLRAEWCLETTKRFRPHYHVIVWLPANLALPKADKRGVWTFGLTNTQIARRAVGYLAKYASKVVPEAMMSTPKGARTFGVLGLDDAARRVMRYWRAPDEARKYLSAEADIRRAPGGYMDRLTGLFWRSPWIVTVDGSGRVFVHRRA